MATYERNNKGKRALLKAARKGSTFWGRVDVARNIAPYEDSELATEFTVTRFFLGAPMCGSVELESILWQFGPLHDSKPAGLRDIAGPAPQVAGPLPDGYEGVLDEAEIRGLEKQVRDGSDPRKRRRIGTWRV